MLIMLILISLTKSKMYNIRKLVKLLIFSLVNGYYRETVKLLVNDPNITRC